MPFYADLFYRYYDGGYRSFAYPTLYLHGFGGTHLSWPHILRRIPRQHIYALDLPGHGLSEIPAYSNIHALVAHVHNFIQEAGIYSLSLVGHSMGSAIAYAYAQTYPERIRGLVLTSFGGNFRYTEELFDSLQNRLAKKTVIEFLEQKGFSSDFPKSMRRKMLAPLAKLRTSVLRADVHACASFRVSSPRKNTSFPVQIIIGRDDQLVTLSSAQQLMHRLPNASLHVIENSGHMVIFERAEVVRDKLESFLGSVSSPG